MSDNECGFCDQDRFRMAEVYIENGECIFFASRDPKIRAEAGLPSDVLPGSGVIILLPIAQALSISQPLNGQQPKTSWSKPGRRCTRS
jgi:hypothetical protein